MRQLSYTSKKVIELSWRESSRSTGSQVTLRVKGQKRKALKSQQEQHRQVQYIFSACEEATATARKYGCADGSRRSIFHFTLRFEDITSSSSHKSMSELEGKRLGAFSNLDRRQGSD